MFKPKTDCFAYKDGECKALTDTYCAKEEKECHFYKKRETVEEDVESEEE